MSLIRITVLSKRDCSTCESQNRRVHIHSISFVFFKIEKLTPAAFNSVGMLRAANAVRLPAPYSRSTTATSMVSVLPAAMSVNDAVSGPGNDRDAYCGTLIATVRLSQRDQRIQQVVALQMMRCCRLMQGRVELAIGPLRRQSNLQLRPTSCLHDVPHLVDHLIYHHLHCHYHCHR